MFLRIQPDICIVSNNFNFVLKFVVFNYTADHLLMSFSEIGKRPPQFCEATFIAQEILDSGFQFDMGEMYYNWFK